MTRKKAWLPFGKARGKHDKLLAITALRHIPGNEASNLLVELANDGDHLVRTKALYVLKQRDALERAAVEEEALLGSEKPTK
jgi:HEAT repeat protein